MSTEEVLKSNDKNEVDLMEEQIDKVVERNKGMEDELRKLKKGHEEELKKVKDSFSKDEDVNMTRLRIMLADEVKDKSKKEKTHREEMESIFKEKRY